MKRNPTDIPKSLKSINVKAILRKRGVFLEQRMNKEAKDKLLPIAKEIIESSKKKVEVPEPQKYAHFSNEIVQAYWEKQIRIVEVIEARFEKKVEQFINKIVLEFLKHLDSEVNNEKSIKKFSTKGYFDDLEDDLLVQAGFDFTPLLMDQAVLAGQEAYKLIGSDDIYLPYKLRETVSRNVTKFTQSMLDTDRDTLVNLISNGLSDGKSVPEIRSSIETSFDSISKNQAQRITRTEVLRVSNQASLDAYEQSGVVEGKQWLTAGAVDECAEYDGDIVTLSGSFYGSDNEFQDGDPPLHPNCRCVILPVLVGEKTYVPGINKGLYERIKQLESQVDKRKKAFKELKTQSY
jgi:SPP1 gp7 family putative phage head morphogenesis protein